MFELREADRDLMLQWDELVHTFSSGTVFHTLKWLQIIGKNQSLYVAKIGLYDNANLIGLFPLFIKKFLFLKVAASPFVVEDTPYMGPLIDPHYFSKFLPALNLYLKKNKIHYLRMISNSFYDLKDTDDSYQFTTKYTHILDLTRTEQELWDNLETRCRTAIRKAQKSGVVIHEMQDRDDIEKYYAMIEQIYHSQNKPCPNPKTLYYDIWDAFGQKQAIFLQAKYRDEIIAGVIIILDGKRAYYNNGTSKNEFKPLSAGNLLLWHAMLIAKEKGIKDFDFVGSDIPRLAKFKESFGGTLSKHTCIEKASSKWVYILREYYPRYKQFVGNLIQKNF